MDEEKQDFRVAEVLCEFVTDHERGAIHILPRRGK